MGRRNVWLVLVSVFVGPLVGALTFMAVTSAMDAFVYGGGEAAYGFLRENWPVVLMAGYVFGAIPGLVFAVVMIILARHIPRTGQRLVAAAIVGAVASVTMLSTVLFGGSLGGMDWIMLIALSLTGAAAGTVSLALVEWLHPLPGQAP